MNNSKFRLMHKEGLTNYPNEVSLEDIIMIIQNHVNVPYNWRVCRSNNLNQGVNASHFANRVRLGEPPMKSFLNCTLVPVNTENKE